MREQGKRTKMIVSCDHEKNGGKNLLMIKGIRHEFRRLFTHTLYGFHKKIKLGDLYDQKYSPFYNNECKNFNPFKWRNLCPRHITALFIVFC